MKRALAGGRRGWRTGEARLIALAALVLAVVLAVGLGHGRPLGHDEATYAVGARGRYTG